MKRLLIFLLCLPLLAGGQAKAPSATRSTSEQLTKPIFLDVFTGAYDGKMGVPYTSVAAANKAIPIAIRTKGRMALIANPKQEWYWYDGGIADSNLKLMIGNPTNAPPASASPWINGADIGMAADWDVSTNETKATDNYYKVQHYLDSMPNFSVLNLQSSYGEFYFSKHVVVPLTKGLNVKGISPFPYLQLTGNVTTWHFQRLDGGIYAGAGAIAISVQDINISSMGTPEGLATSGIYHEIKGYFRNVWGNGFGYGFYATTSNGSDASLSAYDDCRASNNVFDGFYAGGQDANQIRYMGCRSVVNFKNGFTDNSLLGNFYFQCQTATNGRRGSEENPAIYGVPFAVIQPGAATTIVAPYVEDDQSASYIHPLNALAVVIGGLQKDWCGNQIGQPHQLPGGYWQKGNHANKLIVDDLSTDNLKLGNQMSIQKTEDYGQQPRVGVYSWTSSISEWAGANTPVAFIGTYNSGKETAYRSIPVPSTNITGAQFWNGHLRVQGLPGMQGYVFAPEDRIEASPHDVDSPLMYEIVEGGRWSNYPADNFVVSGSYPIDDYFAVALQSQSSYNDLQAGDIVTFDNGAKAQVMRYISDYEVEVDRPIGTTIRDGDNVTIFGDWIEKLKPKAFKEKTIVLTYTPFEKIYNVGDKEYIDGGLVDVLSVSIVGGIETVKFNLPEGQKFYYTDAVGFGPGKGIRIFPVDFDNINTDRPTVTLSFPTAGLTPGAQDFIIDGEHVRVAGVRGQSVHLKALNGLMSSVQPGARFSIQPPKYIAY